MQIVSVDEFLRRWKLASRAPLAMTITYRLGARSECVKTFDFLLTSSVGTEPGLLSKIFGARSPLEGIGGMDEDRACWFDDGWLLPDWSDPARDFEKAELPRFTTSTERKGTALERVKEFDRLCKRLDSLGASYEIWARASDLILQWAHVTLLAEEDPELTRFLTDMLPAGHPKRT